MSFIHQLADVSSDDIGQGTKVWQFAVILKGAAIGQDCNICAHTFIEQDVILGDRVTVKSGVFLWAGTRIGHDVFIGPNATFTNDMFPRSKQYPAEFKGVVVEDGASIGANATLLPGIRIGKAAMVGAGAVVTKDVPAGVVVAGNPARVIRSIERTELTQNC
ncbi:acyltransferase [Nitrincola alkalilacustris]|uniref:acyltransferase n=1 Tax=Nitrincola alkalilacustris TaxID=1571224 RepID=UPI00124CE650|nr:acyltransferase [Nitrincola alkalilacustris]